MTQTGGSGRILDVRNLDAVLLRAPPKNLRVFIVSWADQWLDQRFQNDLNRTGASEHDRGGLLPQHPLAHADRVLHRPPGNVVHGVVAHNLVVQRHVLGLRQNSEVPRELVPVIVG